MPRPLRSTTQARAKDRIAAFVALYTEQAAKPLIETIEPVRITEEPLPSSGSAFCTANKRPRTFVLNVLIEMLLGDLSQDGGLVDPGIRRQHVDLPGLRLDHGVDAVEVGEVGGIALDRRRIAVDRGDRPIQLGLMAAGDKHPRALLGETLGDADTDTGAAAGHQQRFSQ